MARIDNPNPDKDRAASFAQSACNDIKFELQELRADIRKAADRIQKQNGPQFPKKG